MTLMKIEVSIFFGVAIRVMLFYIKDASKFIMNRPEISTPQTSWKQLNEGIFLRKNNISPYNGDSFHDTPLILHYFYWAISIPLLPELTFIIFDVITAISLFLFSSTYVCKQKKFYEDNQANFAKNSGSILPGNFSVNEIPSLVCLMYLLNPFTVSTCIARSTVVINNCFISLIFLNTIRGNLLNTSLFLALSTYQTLYPIQLILPVFYCYYQFQKSNSNFLPSAVKVGTMFTLWMVLLFSLSYYLENSWDSVLAPYKFILMVPDLTPNVGVFWYMFSEMFDHFHSFFMAVFQLNVFIFCIPLTLKLRTRPVFLLFLLTFIIAVFKSYPCVGDISLCLCLLPLWSHTYKYMRHSLVTLVILTVCTILCPVMWNLWIHKKTANANFYFATTLSYSTALVLLMADVLVAYLKHDFHLKKGLKPKLNNKNCLILLKN